MNTTVALVQALRALTPAQQREVLGARLTSVTGLKDWFDVADALLRTDSIDRGLASLSRSQLGALAEGSLSSELLNELVSRGLADAQGVFGEVVTRAKEITPKPSSAPQEKSAAPNENVEKAALERAIVLVSHIDELLTLISARGLRTVSRGTISSADASRVAAAVPGLPADLTWVMSLMSAARLVTRNAGVWSISETADWSHAGVAERWGLLATGWLLSLSGQLRDALTERTVWGAELDAYLSWQYPIDASQIIAQANDALPAAQLLGLVVDNCTTTAGRAVISDRVADAVAAIDALLPAYIDKVLIQSDLTIIAPGPLRPDLESTLRTIASVESRSVASTYRLSPVLLSRAMDAGRSAADIETFLREISSTGIPQPVAYLISDVGGKHASIRVRVDGRGSLITCSTPALAAALQADVSLRALTFTRQAETTLLSPHDASVVMRNLHSEKYPAAFESDTGEIQSWEPATTATATASGPTVDPIAALIQRLNAVVVPVGDDDDAWLIRQIEVAIRNKSVVNVTVALPDGTSRDFVIDPRGLSNGRFRGLDRKSQVERTLPLTSITAISVAEVA